MMGKELMDRRAGDNVYFHPDFHILLKNMFEYCQRNYGEESLRQYLHAFASRFFKPLNNEIKSSGLEPLKEYIDKIYGIEGVNAETVLENNTLTVRTPYCPAVGYLARNGHEIPGYYKSVTQIIYEEICRDTGIRFVLREYEGKTGRSTMEFIG